MKRFLRIIILAIGMVLLVSGTGAAEDMQKGRAIFNDPSLGTNGKSCNSCHQQGRGISGHKDNYVIFDNKFDRLEDAVNFCIRMALKGTPLDKDSDKMKNLVLYIETLGGKKRPIRSIIPGY